MLRVHDALFHSPSPVTQAGLPCMVGCTVQRIHICDAGMGSSTYVIPLSN